MTWVCTAKNQVHERRPVSRMNPSPAVVNHPSHGAGAEHQAAAADKVVPAVKVHDSASTMFDRNNNNNILF